MRIVSDKGKEVLTVNFARSTEKLGPFFREEEKQVFNNSTGTASLAGLQEWIELDTSSEYLVRAPMND